LYLTLRFAWTALLLHSSDPIDDSFTGRPERAITAYEQTVAAIHELWKPGMTLCIGGHSLGGALALIFFAQAAHEGSPWVSNAVLYTFGSPRVGDEQFSRFMEPYRDCIFNVVNNNDVVARIPWKQKEIGRLVPALFLSAPGSSGVYETYHDNPGIFVFIDGSSGNIVCDRPYLRGISFTVLSGTLNSAVLSRMRRENVVRIALRVLLPFFLNDHIPSDYVQMLKIHQKMSMLHSKN